MTILVPSELLGSTTILTRPPKLNENSLQLVIPLHGARRRRKNGQILKKKKKADMTKNVPVHVLKSDKKRAI